MASGRPLRSLVCSGCSRHCRYAAFRAFGEYAGGFAPAFDRSSRLAYYNERARLRRQGAELPHGNAGKRHVGQLEFGEHVRNVAAAAKRQGLVRASKKHAALGMMHATKLELWEQYTSSCPYYGETDAYDDDAGATAGGRRTPCGQSGPCDDLLSR